MPEPTNEERASWARAGLMAFAKETGQAKGSKFTDDEDAVIGDFLCDLLHYMADTNSDPVEVFKRLVENAIGNYEFEVDNEVLDDDSED